jgi:hypothetical protein
MKKITVTTALLSSISLSAFAYNVQIDKGSLHLAFNENLNEPSLSYSVPENCQSRLILNKNKDGITVKHSAGDCPSGAVMTLTMPYFKEVNVQHGGGFIEVLNSEKLIKNAAKLDARTQGLVASEVNSIELIGNYTPNKAYFLSNNSEGLQLNIRLMGGMIQFRK